MLSVLQAAEFCDPELACERSDELKGTISASLVDLYEAMVYVIGEASASLRAVQAETNGAFVADGRLHVAALEGHNSDVLVYGVVAGPDFVASQSHGEVIVWRPA